VFLGVKPYTLVEKQRFGEIHFPISEVLVLPAVRILILLIHRSEDPYYHIHNVKRHNNLVAKDVKVRDPGLLYGAVSGVSLMN
jgi:hypothetical protein